MNLGDTNGEEIMNHQKVLEQLRNYAEQYAVLLPDLENADLKELGTSHAELAHLKREGCKINAAAFFGEAKNNANLLRRPFNVACLRKEVETGNLFDEPIPLFGKTITYGAALEELEHEVRQAEEQ